MRKMKMSLLCAECDAWWTHTTEIEHHQGCTFDLKDAPQCPDCGEEDCFIIEDFIPPFD